jgi:DNA-binding CsgD family transcriptional regulator
MRPPKQEKPRKIDPRDFEDTPELIIEEPPKVRKPRPLLTKREIEYARLWCGGFSYRMIAERLGIKTDTVHGKLARVRSKCNTGNKEAIADMLRGMGATIEYAPKQERTELYEVVREVMATGKPLTFKIPPGKRYENMMRFAHTYAGRFGAKAGCVFDGVDQLWIIRKRA